MIKKFIILFAVSLMPFIWGCDKRLSEPSQKGANIFACKINGDSWIADKGDCFNCRKILLVYNNLFKPRRYFVLSAVRNTNSSNSIISLALDDLKTTGTYHFESDTSPYPGNLYYKNHAFYSVNNTKTKDYVTNSNYTGSITITRLDTINRVVAGKFSFKAENLDGSGKTVKITDGRFDYKW